MGAPGHNAAFPRPCGAANSEEQSLEQDGMTMREWYAGQALVGLLAGGNHVLSPESPSGAGPCMPHVFAQVAFEMADAMLAKSRKVPLAPSGDGSDSGDDPDKVGY